MIKNPEIQKNLVVSTAHLTPFMVGYLIGGVAAMETEYAWWVLVENDTYYDPHTVDSQFIEIMKYAEEPDNPLLQSMLSFQQRWSTR